MIAPSQQSRSMHVTADGERLMTAVVDRLDHGVMIVSSDAELRFANERALAIARCRDAIAFQEGRWIVLAPFVHRRVMSFLRSGHACCDYSLRSSLPRSSGHPDYLLSIHRLSNSDSTDLPRYFLAAIHEPSACSVPSEALREFFGLTPTEAAVVAALFANTEVIELSRQLGISKNTVRTHIRAAYAKCGVRSLSQLLRLIALAPR